MVGVRRLLVLATAFVLLPSTAFAQAAGIANVNFEWTDRSGTTHDMIRAYAEGWEDDGVAGTTPAGDGYTSVSGIGAFTGIDGIGHTETEFFGNIWGQIGAGTTGWARIRDSGGFVYDQRWPASDTYNVVDPPGSGSFTFTVDNTTASGAAMGMLQYVGFMRNFYANTLGATVPYVPIDWHSGTSGSFYCHTAGGAGCPEVRIQIDAQDWASSDVILHEFGHHIAANNGMRAAVGGAHSFGRDNIGSLNGGRNYGAATGAGVAWNEGSSTLMGMMAIHDGGLSTVFPGISGRDVDLVFDDFNTPFSASTQTDADPGNNISISVGIENKAPVIGSTGTDRGEGDEMSVMRAMWDFSDSTNETFSGIKKDLIDYSSQEMFDLMENKQNFRDFWRALAADAVADPSNITLGGAAGEEGLVLATLGMVLEEYRIAPMVVDRTNTADTTPRLEFNEQNNDNSDKYAFAVYSEDWTTLVASHVFDDTNGNETGYFWDVTTPLTPGETYHFAALSNSALDAGATPGSLSDWYWSAYDTFMIVPEPSTGWLIFASLAMAMRAGRSRRPR